MALLSTRIQRIKPSPTLVVSARASALQAQGKDIIALTLGEPDFDTPEHIKAAAIVAINAGKTKYTAVEGTLELRQAIIEKFKRDNSLFYQPKQILVSCGAKHSIFNLFQSIINDGDEVIIPAPYWVSYPDMVKLCGGQPIILSAMMAQNFKITAQQLAQHITPKTRLLVLNSPSNPTGIAYTQLELTALAEVLLRYPKVFIMTDDIYEHILWNQEGFHNIVTVCPALYDRTIVVNGVSKSYAMTGWRIGYAAGPAELIKAMSTLQSQNTSGACSISQAAAVAGLTGDQACLIPMVRAFKERHDYLVPALNSIAGFSCLAGDGTFYAFPNVSQAIANLANVHNDIDFSEYLLNKAEVAVVPGSAFGAPGYIRFSYAASLELIKTAVTRIKACLPQ